jgi:hypothetical protein
LIFDGNDETIIACFFDGKGFFSAKLEMQIISIDGCCGSKSVDEF